MDELAEGSWLGMNDHGVVAVILNRKNTLGPLPGVRSRGELVLDALDHADAADAAEMMGELDPVAYRPFNMIIADNRDAFWVRHADAEGRAPVLVKPLPSGLSMMTAHDLNDPEDPRIRAFLPRFQAADPPDPDAGGPGWRTWEKLMANPTHAVDQGPAAAMCFMTQKGFGTSSSAMIALPSVERPGSDPVFRFAAGPPDRTPFADVAR